MVTHSQEIQVQLVVIVSIDPFTAVNPRITIQLWKGFPPTRPQHQGISRQRIACRVWEADWTHAATPLYILLSDIFNGPAPPAYGNHDCVFLDTAAWREAIINAWVP
jgi:hypothetical protein